jgi:uncharacterized membrane protein (DUF2068 family)
MSDMTEMLPGSLAIVLGATALVLGGHVMREAWRDAFKEPLAQASVSQASSAEPDSLARMFTDLGWLRLIAGFEALKGTLALMACLGLFAFLHHDLRLVATALIGHIGLQPGAHYPALALHELDRLAGADLRPLLLAAAGYTVLRFSEAYGLWMQRPWGAQLGASSGALYVPFELWHLAHQPKLITVAVLIANIAVVLFLLSRLVRSTAAS